MRITAPVAGRIAHLPLERGANVSPQTVVALLEVMKMEHPVLAGVSGRLDRIDVGLGDNVEAGASIAEISEFEEASPQPAETSLAGPIALDEVVERHRIGLDEARPEAVAKRHATGKRTAREVVGDLTYEFLEFGPLVIAGQRGRREVADLVANTPADGLVAGVGRVDTGTDGDDRAIVLTYDYTVLAGTQGMQNHRKKDRLFRLAAETQLPVVLFAEGGGGRPGDVDWPGASTLDVPAFRLFAEIPGPTIGINTGYCFAGNAALLGQCDVIVATGDSYLGMGGPAMIEGGGLGRFAPTEVGPTDVQTANGVIDVLVDDDKAAVEVARQLLGLVRGPVEPGAGPDQTSLRSVVPPNRREVYDMHEVIDRLVDGGTFIEMRPGFAPAAVVGLGRVDGRPLGIMANNPAHLAGAVDDAAARAFADLMALCDKWGLPVLSLCDTPGFMVGPEAEAEGLVRSAGRLFRASAGVSVPTGTIVTRRGYGLGAMAMASGGFQEPRFTVAWPGSEFGPMGLEGAVKLGFRKELEAIEDPEERQAELERRVDEMYEEGSGLNVASHYEIDDVIDPADSRRWISTLF